MQLWIISVPGKAEVFIKELRKLALLEFIPIDWFQNTLKEMFGMKVKDTVDLEEGCGASAPSSDKCGKSLVDNLGAMPIVALVIVLFMGFLYLAQCLAKKYTRFGLVY